MADEEINTPEWRDVIGYEGLYRVSDCGDVMRVGRAKGAKPGRILKPYTSATGYFEVGLSRDSVEINWRVHRLVAVAFHGPPPESKPQVNHKNGIKTDNHATNLEWASSLDDGQHRSRMGLIPAGDRHYYRRNPEMVRRGEQCGRTTKLTADTVIAMRLRYAKGGTMREIADEFHATLGNVFAIVRRVTWKHLP